MSAPLKPFGPIPSPRQLAWHSLEYYAFVHFNMNTFTGKEWGEGYEDPKQFNPTALDCRQWARVCKAAGMKGIILTAKHHDGFCLWPSRYTNHSVKNSPWRGGKGDILREFSDACRAEGLKVGLYLSPWDRNHPDYGDSAKYNAYFLNQLTEVLTGYGPLFEFWFDGANGEGPNGKKQVYDWPAFIGAVRRHQPNAVIFSDAGPDIRWVGNESGHAQPTNWSLLRRDEFYPGVPNKNAELGGGQIDGTHWVPAECDVSIRPGWFYRESEDARVKTVAQLLEIYYASVGQNASLLLNLPVDKRGLVHEIDAERVLGLRRALDRTFAHDLARGKLATASDERDGAFSAARAVDGDARTFWSPPDPVTTASLEVDLGRAETVNRIVVQEQIALGQRVESFSVEAHQEGKWRMVGEGTTIGAKRILRVPSVTASRFRLNIVRARACPTIQHFGLFAASDKEDS